MRSVYVVGAHRWCGPSTADMFRSAGYTVYGDEWLTDRPAVDLVAFTGGSDINPAYYGQELDGTMGVDTFRDQFEIDVFGSLLSDQKVVGICRGAQLINVMNGFPLIQHHGYIGGPTEAFDPDNNSLGEVYACHHQGILAPVENSLAFIDSSHYEAGAVHPDTLNGQYPSYAVLFGNHFGVQWHPEWNHENSEKVFFDLMERHLFKEAA